MFVLRFVGVACAVQVLAARVTGKSWESGLQEAAWLASGWRFPATGSIASPGGIALIKYCDGGRRRGAVASCQCDSALGPGTSKQPLFKHIFGYGYTSIPFRIHPNVCKDVLAIAHASSASFLAQPPLSISSDKLGLETYIVIASRATIETFANRASFSPRWVACIRHACQ